MTAGAFDSTSSFDELAIVNVLVAVDAFLERQRFLEVTLQVASRTFNRLVLAQQGIFRFGMVEFLVDRLHRAALPAARVVACRAGLLVEAALVWIGVAIVALTEGQTGPPRLVVRSGSVALLASHLRVQSRQRVFGFRVIELREALPVFEIVTTLTVLSQAAVVCVLVTGGASLRHTEKSLVQVSDLNAEFLSRRYVFGIVAFVARHSGVFPDEVVTSLTVVKSGRRWRPLDQRKIHPVMV